MASELLEKDAVATVGLDVYARLSTSPCAMWYCASRVLSCAGQSFRTGGCRLRLRDDEEAFESCDLTRR